MKNKLLIITSADDVHADHLIHIMNSKGFSSNVIRLNTESFNSNTFINFNGNDFEISLKDSGRIIYSNQIAVVWYRRPTAVELPSINSKEVNDFIEKQVIATLRGLYFCLHDSAFWINPLTSLHRDRIKLQQLQLANKIGFKVPATLVTNNYLDAVSFFNKYKLICNKSLDEPLYYLDNQLHEYMTKLIDDIEVINEAKESIESCPTLFQEYIEKDFDIRITIFDKKIFAYEIHSQSDSFAKVDFRGKAPHLLTHKKHKLPLKIKNLLYKYMKHQNLFYSAFDLVFANNNYYFIENNPNGQYLWVELITGDNMTDYFVSKIVEFLEIEPQKNWVNHKKVSKT